MKKTLITLMAVLFIFTACTEEELETLADTKWVNTSTMKYSHQGVDYDVKRTSVLHFETARKGKLVHSEAEVNEDITAPDEIYEFTYTYSGAKGEINFKESNATFTTYDSNTMQVIPGNPLLGPIKVPIKIFLKKEK